MGVVSLLGLSAPLHGPRTLIYSLDLRDRVCQFRLASGHLYRYRLWTWTSRGAQTAVCEERSLAEAPLVAQAIACNCVSDFVSSIQARILVQGRFKKARHIFQETVALRARPRDTWGLCTAAI